MNRIVRIFSEMLRCERGVAYIEFGVSISIMLLLFLGSVEVSRCMMILQKLEKTVSTVADVTTQTDPNTSPLSSSQLSQLMSAVNDMMNPYSSGSTDPNILVIVTDVTKTGSNNPVINWQYCGGGSLSATSRVGTTVGAAAALPNGFTMNAGEEVVIGEVFYNFRPIIAGNNFFASFQMYKTTIYMPRLGALTAFSSHC